jgi:sigma-B regulation protein RsbU (phosphoserine phosphatase)
MYATSTALRIYPKDADGACRVEYAIAGQPAMLLASGDKVCLLADQQLPLGPVSGRPYSGHCIDVHAGDTFLVATDGILEAASTSGEEFGLDRLEQILRENRSQQIPQIPHRIYAALSASYVQDDDQSLLLVRLNS